MLLLPAGTASAGQAGYSATVISHRCDVIYRDQSLGGTWYEGVHCANLIVARTSATTAEVWAQGEAYCQTYVSGGPVFVDDCQGITQRIGLYTPGPTAIRGPVDVPPCGNQGGLPCPGSRYVHSIAHYVISSGCLPHVWTSVGLDYIDYIGGDGTGSIASGHFKVCNNGVYTPLA